MLSSVVELEASFVSFVGGANFHEHVQGFGEYKVDDQSAYQLVQLYINNVVLELGLCTQILASTVEGIAATVLDQPQEYFCRQLVYIFIHKLTRSRILQDRVQRRIFYFQTK